MTLDVAHPPETEQSFICVIRTGGFVDLEAAEEESKFGDCSCYSVLFSLAVKGW